jgi:nitronate monooxygenase
MFLVSGPDMVVAAADEGIVGAFPTLNARTTADLERWLQDISGRLQTAREEGTGRSTGTWAANIVAHRTNPRFQQDMELLLEYRPPIVITALGSPRNVVESVHGYGGIVVADVNSVVFARKAADAGVDGLILVASGAGGHTGQMSPFAFVETVRQFWDGLLVLAGGISTGRGVKAALDLGADLACLGTRFIATRESLARADHKQMVIDCNFDDIVCTNAFTGAWANMLRPSISRAGYDPENLGPAGKIDVSDDPQSDARAWKDIFSAGHGVGTVHGIQSMHEVVEELCAEFLS